MKTLKKKCKVIMLPTEDKNPLNCGLIKTYFSSNEPYLLGIAIQNKEICFYSPDKSGGSLTTPLERNLPNWKGQHLYITSDDEIKKGDWYLYLDNNTKEYLFDQEKGAFKNHNWTCNKLNRFTLIGKIIATTDKSLTISKDITNSTSVSYSNNNIKTVTIDTCLPQPSQAFIEKYCELGGVDEVMVEYETIHDDTVPYLKTFNSPKVNSRNEITTPLTEEKVYSEEDLKKAFRFYAFSSASQQPYSEKELQKEFENFKTTLKT